MEDRLSRLEANLLELTRSVAEVELRLARLESRPGEVRPLTPAAAVPARPPEPEAPPASSDLASGLALLGRTFLALGGAYLLRALTAPRLLPDLAGVLLASLYALVWLGLADRAAAKGHRPSAAFHGGTAALIAFPLLWEATTRFQYLAPGTAAAALAAFTLAVLAVAWRRDLQPLAWIGGAGAVATAFVLLAATRDWVPFVLVLLLVALAGIWLRDLRGWSGLGWVLTGAAPLGVLLATTGASIERAVVSRPAAVALGLLLVLTVLASIAVRALSRQGREVGAFEALYGAAAVLAGYGGAVFVAARDDRAAALVVGLLGLALAVAAYGAAFARVERRQRRNLLFFSSLGLAFLLAGSSLLLGRPALALAWAALAAVAAWQAVRISRVTLALHGALYALAAAIASGLFAISAHALAAAPGLTWPPLTATALLALAAAALCAALPVPRPAPFWKPYASTTKALQLTVLVWGAAGAVLYIAVPLLAGPPGNGVDPGRLAALRTMVLAGAALVLGWAARFDRFREAGWLVYPLLLLGAVKLVVEDFPHGRPLTLFVALAVCGGAFILAPRLVRQAGHRPAGT